MQRRLDRRETVVSTTEAVLFEWTERSDRPEFKSISEMIKAHDAARLTAANRNLLGTGTRDRPVDFTESDLSLPRVRPRDRIPIDRNAARPRSSPSRRLLLGPGPSEVHPRVLAALGLPLLGHLDPEFIALMDETQNLLRSVFRTDNRLTMAVSGTGSAGMEAVVVNLIEPGDRMLVCVNGVFGGRMVDVAQRAGAEVTAIERPYGEVFDPDEVRAAVKKVAPKLVGIVHAETSTGAWQPV